MSFIGDEKEIERVAMCEESNRIRTLKLEALPGELRTRK